MICCDKEENIVRCFRGKYSFLSNFYPAKVFFDGVTYLNSESAYQAQKCKNAEKRFRFANLSSDEAKSLGRKVDCTEETVSSEFNITNIPNISSAKIMVWGKLV